MKLKNIINDEEKDENELLNKFFKLNSKTFNINQNKNLKKLKKKIIQEMY